MLKWPRNMCIYCQSSFSFHPLLIVPNHLPIFYVWNLVALDHIRCEACPSGSKPFRPGCPQSLRVKGAWQGGRHSR